MRRCTLCLKWLDLSAANFPLTKKGFGYLCNECKTIDNAIRYRKKKLANPPAVIPFAEQERKILLRALAAARGNMGAAADMLGMVRSTFFRKIESYRETGLVSAMELDAFSIIRKELSELEAKWKRLRRRARILRLREARDRDFERQLDKVVDVSQRERERSELKQEIGAEQRNRDAIQEAQQREAQEQAVKRAMRRTS
jgi:hypothetical protein